MANIAAVVVTFNRLDKLKNVLASLEAQTTPPARLIIVDNASTDGTGEYLRSYDGKVPTEVITAPTNTGGAGGFYLGMKAAHERGFEYSWIMDDDAYPEPDALANLLRGYEEAVDELGHEVPFACSVVNFMDGNICEMNNPIPTWDWGRLLSKGQKAVMVTRCSFVSVLIPRWVVEEFGYPRKEYFIWFDDAEYTARITAKCPGVQVLDSIVLHDLGDNKGVNFTMIDSKNAWKFKYGIRNEASYQLHSRGFPHYLMFVANVQRQMSRGRVPFRLRGQMTKQMLQAITFDPKIEYPAK